MSMSLEIYLTVFITVAIVLLIICGVFLIKLMVELSRLTNSLNDIATVVKSDLEPTIKEVKLTLKSINSIVQEADKKVSDFSGIATKLLGATSVALTSVKGLTGSFWKGLSAGMNLFKKH